MICAIRGLPTILVTDTKKNSFILQITLISIQRYIKTNHGHNTQGRNN